MRVLEEPKRGAASARNAGIRAARGEVVAFTDSDCSPDPNWLLNLASPFEDPVVGAVAGRVVGAPGTSPLEVFSSLFTLRLPEAPSRHREWTPRSGGFPTANFSVRRALASEMGSFDEGAIISGEDYDFCARLYQLGVVVAYLPEVKVAHHHRVTLRGMMKQAFGFGRGHAYLFRRHGAGLWIDFPVRNLDWRRSPVAAWLDLASADKKVLAILLLAALYGPALLALPLYAGWLALAAARRVRGDGASASAAAALSLAGLLVLKSAAMTAGRWWGSVKHGAICF